MNRNYTAADVSIVIPTCNRCDVLDQCLRALAVQTAAPREIIVVDDCSTDDTPAVIGRFIAEYPKLQVKYIRTDSPRGANPSRNIAIREASGAIIAMLDNDSIARPDWLEELAKAFTVEDIAAVVGLVEDAPPKNIFDLTYRGTHRVAGPGPARRLVGCNMAIRRDVALKYMMDEDRDAPLRDRHGNPETRVSGRGDEEGLYLMMKAAGHQIICAPRAVVLHIHYYKCGAFFRQAWRGGRSAARLVYKFHLPPRFDLLPFMLAYITLPLGFINLYLLLIPAFFFLAALVALAYNDVFRKGKTILQTIITFPVLLAYYHVRLVSYILESLRLRLTKHDLKRVRLAHATE